MNRRSVLNRDIGTDRQHVTGRGTICQLDRFTILPFQGYPRTLVRLLSLGNNLTGHTGDFIDLFLHGGAFSDVTIVDHATDFGDNRHGVGVPLGQDVTAFDFATFLASQTGTVNNRITFFLTSGTVNNSHLTFTVHDNREAVTIVNGVQVDKLQGAVKTRFKSCLFCPPRSSTTDVEGPHGELGTRFTNRLGRNNPNRFTQIDQVPTSQITTVTKRANTTLTLACQNRTDLDFFDPCFFDLDHQIFIDHPIGLH